MTTPKTPQTATASLVAALAELDNVKANKINPAFKARYVSLDALLDAIKPVLLDHDLALIQTLVSEDGKVGVSTAFLHASGERFDFGKLMVKADGLTAQQIGGAITYIRRQSIQTACGISVDLDDDGATASRPAGPASGRPWSAFIPADLTDKAKAYVVGKGWLKDGQKLTDLPDEHVATILGNQTAFLNVIRR